MDILIVKKQFLYYKLLADKALSQIDDKEMIWFSPDDSNSNSIAIIMQHIIGNIKSRWTNFLTEDGEKPWRNRDQEFIPHKKSYQELLEDWEDAWCLFFDTFNHINNSNIHQVIYIRQQSITVADAYLRQLAHYPYHIGQIVYLAKWICKDKFLSLSIPRHKSDQYNYKKYNFNEGVRHYLDDLLGDQNK